MHLLDVFIGCVVLLLLVPTFRSQEHVPGQGQLLREVLVPLPCDLNHAAITSETNYNNKFPASNVLIESQDVWCDSCGSKPNYWLTKNGAKEQEAYFTMDLACHQDVAALIVINTHNAKHKDRSTKKFKLLGAKTAGGTFEELLVASLPDSRELDPVPSVLLPFPQTNLRYIRFEILEFWGVGGGLQYLELLPVAWHATGRCGPNFPIWDGMAGYCGPVGISNAVGRCCSSGGWCGNTDEYCKCQGCLDYSNNSGLGVKLEAVTAILSTSWLPSFPADKCNDGDIENFCHSIQEKAPWLALDFASTVSVARVVIHNRVDCCEDRLRNVEIRVSDELPESGSLMFTGGKLLGTFADAGGKRQIAVSSGTELLGRYVVIQIDNGQEAEYLNLAEVTAWTGCCSTLNVIGKLIPNGKYIRTSQLHNNRAVFKNGDSCIFYGRHWKIDGCAWLKTGDHSVGLIWSSVDTVCPESIAVAWRYYNWGPGGTSSGPVNTSISVNCIDYTHSTKIPSTTATTTTTTITTTTTTTTHTYSTKIPSITTMTTTTTITTTTTTTTPTYQENCTEAHCTHKDEVITYIDNVVTAILVIVVLAVIIIVVVVVFKFGPRCSSRSGQTQAIPDEIDMRRRNEYIQANK